MVPSLSRVRCPTSPGPIRPARRSTARSCGGVAGARATSGRGELLRQQVWVRETEEHDADRVRQPSGFERDRLLAIERLHEHLLAAYRTARTLAILRRRERAVTHIIRTHPALTEASVVSRDLRPPEADLCDARAIAMRTLPVSRLHLRPP